MALTRPLKTCHHEWGGTHEAPSLLGGRRGCHFLQWYTTEDVLAPMSYAHTCLPETLIKLGRPHTEKLWSRRRLAAKKSFSGGKGRWQGGGEWVKGIIETCQTAEQREKKTRMQRKKMSKAVT